MIRSARLGLFSALSTSALILTGCSGTPTDGEPVVISRAAPTPAAVTTPVDALPHIQTTPAVTPATEQGTTARVPAPEADSARVLEPTTELSTEDLLFLSNITEFTLMEKSESDQIRLGLSMCNSLYRGRSKGRRHHRLRGRRPLHDDRDHERPGRGNGLLLPRVRVRSR